MLWCMKSIRRKEESFVFSEIYYPGWQATVDGEPVEIVCADLYPTCHQGGSRKHTVAFKFDPKSLHVTETVANVSLVLLMLGMLFLLGREVWKRRKETQK